MGRPDSSRLPADARLLPALRRAIGEHELLTNLLLRDLRSRYRRTLVGWGWSMLNPALMAVIYTFVFTVFFKVRPDPGQPSGMTEYAFYLLSGLLPWNALVNGATGGIGALMGGAGLLSKVRFAREHLVLSTVLAMIVSLGVELLVLAALILVAGHMVLQYLVVCAVLMVLLAMFVAGIALALSALNVRYRDVQHLTGIGFLVWFYLTPVVYPASLIPEHRTVLGASIPLRSILGMNPMSRFILAFRNCLFDGRLPGAGTMAGLVLTSTVTFVVGYRFFIRRAPWFAEEL